MSNTYTFMWQPQNYKSWKGKLSTNQLNVVVPNEKRPVAAAVPTQGLSKSSKKFGPSQRATTAPAIQIGRNSRVGGKAINANGQQVITGGVGARARNYGPQPLKHWRLQLNPDNTSGYSKMSVANFMDRPGSAINLKTTSPDCSGCNASGNSLYGKLYIKDNYLGPKAPNNSGTNIQDISNNIFDCIACNPETNRIKSAVTLLNKNYYTNTSSYLKSRCMTYDQKLSFDHGTPTNNGHGHYVYQGIDVNIQSFSVTQWMGQWNGAPANYLQNVVSPTAIGLAWWNPVWPIPISGLCGNNAIPCIAINASDCGVWGDLYGPSPATYADWITLASTSFPGGIWVMSNPGLSWAVTYEKSTSDPAADLLAAGGGKLISAGTPYSGRDQYYMLNCCSDKCSKRQITIYKPNNVQFQQQGAVSSSGRLAKLKYDTITKNGASFRSAYGAQAANAGKYTASPNTPYFIKNKINVCNPSIYHRNGNKTLICQ